MALHLSLSLKLNRKRRPLFIQFLAAPDGGELDEGVRVPGGEPVEEFSHALSRCVWRVLAWRPGQDLASGSRIPRHGKEGGLIPLAVGKPELCSTLKSVV
jgi:hypothetical protein